MTAVPSYGGTRIKQAGAPDSPAPLLLEDCAKSARVRLGDSAPVAYGSGMRRFLLCLSLFVFGVAAVPAPVASLRWGPFYDGDVEAQRSLARGVEDWVDEGVTDKAFATGSARFDNEWHFGAMMMAAMGFGQTALEHPELTPKHAALMTRCIDDLLAPEGHTFDTDAWGKDPLDDLQGTSGHIAFLGYANLALSLARLVGTDAVHAGWNDRLTAAIARRYEAHPGTLIETYPGERYPVDNAAAIAALAVYDRATGANHQAIIHRWIATAARRWVDKPTGMLLQYIHRDGSGEPRGSGTLLAAYFLSFADARFSEGLFEAAKRNLHGSVLGFEAMREFPHGVDHRGDIDSGPLIAGFGISPTGFALGSARTFQDRNLYVGIGATVEAFGAPVTADGALHFTTGGPLGDAILFAMLTAPTGPL